MSASVADTPPDEVHLPAPPRPDLEPIVTVRHLVKHFPVFSGGFVKKKVGEIHATCDVSFDLYPGSTLGLVGESGSGKSTVAKSMLRLHEPTDGEIHYRDLDVRALRGRNLRVLRKELQIVFQDPFASLDPRLSASAIVAEPLKVHRFAGSVSDRVGEVLAMVGLDPVHGDRYPHEFSGGQRQRIGIARALALEPAVVVLDEPVSALDVSIQAGVVNLLEDLQDRLDLAYLFVAHDMSVVRHISDQVAVMYLGRLVEFGTRDDVFTRTSHPYTQALMSAVPIPDPERERRRRRIVLEGDLPSPITPPSGCRFRTRCWKAQDLCAEQVPALVDRGQGHPVACHFPDEVDILAQMTAAGKTEPGG
ncbi:MAG: ATP-binding cassette domain-containing protein [Actinomycetota bacterium]|nr:ATP-binding cassette domain-containing protein [Actinomycetota bacterium]